MAQPTEFLSRLKSEENNARKVKDIKKDYMLQKERKGNKNYDPDYKPGNPLYDADEIEFTRLDDLAKEATRKFNDAKKGFETSQKQKDAKDNLVKGRLENIESGKTPDQIEADATESVVDLDSFTKQIEEAGSYIANLSSTGLKELALGLNTAYGLSLPVNGIYSPDIKSAYLKALSDNLVRSLDFNRTIPFAEFLVTAGNEGTYRSGSGAGAGPTMSGSISDPTRAAALINSAFRSQLQRDPTAAEVAKYTKILNRAEKKNPFKTVNGITTGGLDKEQFLIGELVKLPEFATKKTDKVAITGQSILGTARANGVTLNQGQIDSFAKRVQDGTDINIIDKEIRSIAALGMPDKVIKLLDQGVDLDTIYSPYRNLMASILELNPESIDLKDPTLRSAIGPDKEMPIYDFEKALRKDYRWQYTDNAKRDVSNVTLKVLRDFGFQS